MKAVPADKLRRCSVPVLLTAARCRVPGLLERHEAALPVTWPVWLPNSCIGQQHEHEEWQPCACCTTSKAGLHNCEATDLALLELQRPQCCPQHASGMQFWSRGSIYICCRAWRHIVAVILHPQAMQSRRCQLLLRQEMRCAESKSHDDQAAVFWVWSLRRSAKMLTRVIASRLTALSPSRCPALFAKAFPGAEQ